MTENEISYSRMRRNWAGGVTGQLDIRSEKKSLKKKLQEFPDGTATNRKRRPFYIRLVPVHVVF